MGKSNRKLAGVARRNIYGAKIQIGKIILKVEVIKYCKQLWLRIDVCSFYFQSCVVKNCRVAKEWLQIAVKFRVFEHVYIACYFRHMI